MIIKIYIVTYLLFLGIAARRKFNLCEDTDELHCYKKEIIASVPHSPNQMAVDKNSNTLFFSFDSGQGEYTPAKLTIGNKTTMVLRGVKDAFAMASDPHSGEVYFGGSHGIYRYNVVNKRLQRLYIDNLDIWWLVVKKSVYFIKFPSLGAYKYENKTIRPMWQLKNHVVHQFVFDMEDNIFFINNTGLYGIKSGDFSVIFLGGQPRFLSITTDNNGTVYLCGEDGIYMLSKVVQKIKRVVNVQGVLGLTFDKNNLMIYSDSHDLVRLVPVSKDAYYLTDPSSKSTRSSKKYRKSIRESPIIRHITIVNPKSRSFVELTTTTMTPTDVPQKEMPKETFANSVEEMDSDTDADSVENIKEEKHNLALFKTQFMTNVNDIESNALPSSGNERFKIACNHKTGSKFDCAVFDLLRKR